MKLMRGYFVAAVLILTLCGSALGYSYTPSPVYTDTNTGLQWEDPGYFAFMGWNTTDFIQNSGVHLATYGQLVQLFSDIGPYSPQINKLFGATFMGTFIMINGYYDAGNGSIGMAYGGFSSIPGGKDIPWTFVASDYYSPDIGLWAVVDPAPVPEPCSVLLFGIGLAGIVVGKRRMRSYCEEN
jgi:hypothetical protein